MTCFQAKSVLAVDLILAAVDVGADPEVNAGGGRVEGHAFLAVVHVLEILLEEGDVDDFAGGEGGIVEGGGEGLGISVGAVASGGAIGDLGGTGTAKRCGVGGTVWEAVECELYIGSRGAGRDDGAEKKRDLQYSDEKE